MPFDISTEYLSDEDANRLYIKFPELRGVGPEDFCPTCLTTKTYRWQGKDVECPCDYQLQLYKHYLNAGIGVLYQRLDWPDYSGNEDIKDEVLGTYLPNHQQYVNRGLGLMMTGTVGSGKTMLANLILKEFVKLGYDCYATTFNACVDAFTAGWSSKSDKDWFARKFTSTRVLLLDDLGREFRSSTGLSATTFDNLLRTRVQEGKVTLLTTNMTALELGSGYGSGALSLLTESSLNLKFSGDDYRPLAGERTRRETFAQDLRPIF